MAEIEYCEYVTGVPERFYNFLVAAETTGAYVQLYVDAEIEVDWGSGHYLKYEEGIIYGRQEDPYNNKPIIFRSSNSVTKLYFGNGASYDKEFLTIDIVKAFDLTDATKLCYRLEELKSFTFFGNNKIESFESAWEDCTELLEFEGMDTTRALTMKRAWKNTNKLVEFPNVYASECLTVEEAWMGCTCMREFPIIDTSNCLNYRNAWRGNVQLTYFPFIDTGAGQNFDHAWAYTTKLSYFPSLDFRNALNMDYAFAYMKNVTTMPFIDSPLSPSFHSTFRKMLRLECIAGVDTNGVSSRDYTTDMFLLSDALQSPTETEQERIRDGYKYINDNPCYFNAGRSVFFVHCKTNGEESSITITGGDFEIDWGDGLFLPYREGTISDIPIFSNGINIRSEEEITKIEFNTDTFESIEIKRGRTITNVVGIASHLDTLTYFEILGGVDTGDFTDLCAYSPNLYEVGTLDLDDAIYLTRAFKGCSSLVLIGNRYYDDDLGKIVILDLEMPVAIDLECMFNGCEAIEHLQKCVTPVGQNFTQMFANMTALTCLYGIDTRNQTVTTDMFYNTPALARPSVNEQTNILAGILYDNGGNCGGTMNVSFLGGGECTFYCNDTVFVDWGNGVFIEYASSSAASPIVGTQSGAAAYIIGFATDIVWVSDTFTEVEFIDFEELTSMNAMFKNKTLLTKFTFTGDSVVTDYAESFMNSGIVTYVGPINYVGAEDFNYMFSGTTDLDTVNAMYTIDGTNFECMFENSGLNCLQEIYTCKGQFPPNYKSCLTTPIKCVELTTVECDDAMYCSEVFITSTELDCSGTLYATKVWRCAPPDETILALFSESTMFDGCVPVSPSPLDKERIMNRYHFIGAIQC